MYTLIRSLARTTREQWHSRRAQLFLDVMNPRPGMRVLDVGGGDGEFMGRICKRVQLEVTVADIDDAALSTARSRGFATVKLREGDPLPFGDQQFDLVFCNSVIEHVTLPKRECKSTRFANAEWIGESFRSQRAFAKELRRIGGRYFVQTPHRGFPVEAHTWLPFVGWLPHSTTVRLVRLTDHVWVKHCGKVDWNLLDEHDMSQLFPDAHLHVERVLGLAKSLIAYSRA